MVETTRTAQVTSIGTEYNSFLYATIGTDANGTQLSVLSAMARMNLDPWQEAANLAALPGKEAAGRLASLIAVIPGAPSVSGDPGIVATRLIKLLPSQTRIILPVLPSRKDLPGIDALTRSRTALFVIVALIVMALGTLWTNAHRSAPPPPNSTQISAANAPQNVPSGH
jgi:hypothetical protein